MYSKEKQKPNKNHRNLPSFSSTLLDEICRSIDETPETPDAYRDKPTAVFRGRRSSSARDETSRSYLVEKWMQSREKAKKMENRDSDLQFFSSNSSSSDSSSGLSSSDTEFFSSSKASDSVKRPKPVRTSAPPHPNRDRFSPDDYRREESSKSEEKSKSRALKIYASLRKLRQPISPGMKLTSLINSFFSRKKSREGSRSKLHQEQSSSSSAARWCMTKNSSKENLMNGTKRTAGFDPVGVTVDRDSRPCGGYDDRYGRPPLPPKVLEVEDGRKFDYRDGDEDEDDDVCSESSSDLFELDHLSSMFGKGDGFCEELPVYKTTYIGKNRGLIR